MPTYANMGILRGRKGILGEEYGKEQLQRKNVKYVQSLQSHCIHT
jgi:hypothetical protein